MAVGLGGGTSSPSKPPPDRQRAGAGRIVRFAVDAPLWDFELVMLGSVERKIPLLRHAFPLFCGKAALRRLFLQEVGVPGVRPLLERFGNSAHVETFAWSCQATFDNR